MINRDDTEQLITLLSSGPICIGESHTDDTARKKLIDLIRAGKVKKLFLEIPACTSEVQNFMAQNEKIKLTPSNTPVVVKKYLENINVNTSIGDRSSIKWHSIISIAKEHGVSVYFHDLPTVESVYQHKKNIFMNFPEDTNLYLVNPSKYAIALIQDENINILLPRFKQRMMNAHNSNNGVKIRNQYSAEVIKNYTDSHSLDGVVIFGGSNHFDKQYDKDALQSLCHIDQERVFDFDTKMPIHHEAIKAASFPAASFPKVKRTLLILEDKPDDGAVKTEEPQEAKSSKTQTDSLNANENKENLEQVLISRNILIEKKINTDETLVHKEEENHQKKTAHFKKK